MEPPGAEFWVFSGFVHVVLLLLFLLVTVSGSASPPDTSLTTIVSLENDLPADPNFNNPDEGNNPGEETQYDVSNIGNESIPGPPMPNTSAGIDGATEDVRRTIPPPLGIGNGQGGGVPDPTTRGSGGVAGLNGGYPDGVRLRPGGFPGNGGQTRQQLLNAHGGNTKSEMCVTLGLMWIARHQRLDGSWGLHDFHVAGKCNCRGAGANNDLAATGLALLPFLAAGETHRGVGKSSRYAKPIERALSWIIRHQGADGRLGEGYAHGIAALALCDAYNLTADPLLKGPAQRAINCIVNWQADDGGFRYRPKEPGDISVTGWHLQALKSGQMAGLHVPNATIVGAIRFLDRVSIPDQSALGYMNPDQAMHRRTSIGLLCREYLGWGPHHPAISKGVESLGKLPPAANHKDIYYYYYATQVMFHGSPEPTWIGWNNRMRRPVDRHPGPGRQTEIPRSEGELVAGRRSVWHATRPVWRHRAVATDAGSLLSTLAALSPAAGSNEGRAAH